MTTDPLARSSSSLFPEPHRQGAMQRSTGKLFTFRRHRQSSEARPSAGGNPGTRRRGFTMPLSYEPPELPEEVLQRGRGATVAGEHEADRRGSEGDYKAGRLSNGGDYKASRSSGKDKFGMGSNYEAGRISTEWPINRTIMPQRPAQQAARQEAENSRAEQSAPFSSSAFAAAHLHSSFSPPGTPPRRTICSRARLLMTRICGKKQGTMQPPLDSQRTPPPFSMSSALCTTKPASRVDPQAPRGPVAQSGARQPARVFPASRQPRALPRSPLANPVVLADEAPVETADPAAHTTDESSSEEDRKCQLCTQYRAAEWTVECNSGHVLCFGCVQAHVRQLLAANSTTWDVPCPAECTASISIKQLHACLPPRRVQQLVANRRQSKAGLLQRSLSLSVRPSQPSLDDGFDAPLDPQQPAHVSEESTERFSASMPVLNPNSIDPSGPMLSELTSVEPGSVDSLVLAASAAADSSQTLSPQLLGSRLRRIPQALSPPAPCPASPDHEPARDADPSHHSKASPHDLEPKQPPPAEFRASATWITPSQRYSGFAENLLLNATLFETIRRSSIDEGSELPFSSTPSAGQRMPIPQSVIPHSDDDDGVYIPTWRKPSGSNLPPSICDEEQYGSQSGVLCEAAELNFYLYETLRRH
ncbi:hypothetical protein IWW36_003000 [Coemansia brasiliensis]|uniref:Uncharacterized protein n=1 Tax=Coemansia brasiliensis TaxID=2650707 RepID=A0A9W8IDM9_9FUNG|nr:hypothetical protein IWW36_003000 [Coemansia brasiliensis]